MPRAPLSLALLIALGLGPIPGGVAPAYAQDDEMGASSFTEIRDQGLLYQRKRRYKQAKAALDKAYAMPEGPGDFKTVYYRGEAAYKLLLVEQAFEMTAAAAKLAKGKRQKADVLELQTELDSLFGKVTFKAAAGETNAQGRIFFESKTGIINREKKKRFQSIQSRFKSTDITLPITVYLPYGEYLANKVPFSIAQGAEAPEIEIFLQVQQEEEDNTWMWVGIGAGTVAAVGLGVGAVVLLAGDPPPPNHEIDIQLPNEVGP